MSELLRGVFGLGDGAREEGGEDGGEEDAVVAEDRGEGVLLVEEREMLREAGGRGMESKQF